MTFEQLQVEWLYWKHCEENAGNQGSRNLATLYRRACDQWMDRLIKMREEAADVGQKSEQDKEITRES